MESKKTEELVILELFRDLWKDFPKGVLNVTESPDFILSLAPRKKIGIELTRLHLHLPVQDPFAYENISACLQLKEDKLSLYRKKRLQEYWLILSIRDPTYNPRYNLHNKLNTWKFESGYNRIFVFNVLDGGIFELQKKERRAGRIAG